MDLPSKHQAGQSRWLHHGALPSACQISRSGRGGKEPPTRWPHAGRKHHMIVGSPELQCGLEEGSWHPCQCQSYCLLPFETYKSSSRSAMEKERAQWWGVWLWFTHTRTHAHTCTHAHTRTHTHTPKESMFLHTLHNHCDRYIWPQQKILFLFLNWGYNVIHCLTATSLHTVSTCYYQ